jgi:phage terminase large subunit
MVHFEKASGVFIQNYYTDAPVIVNQGGTSSGKTLAIMQVLFCLATEGAPQVITVVGQDIPNLKSGAMRDAQNIYDSSALLRAAVKRFNQTDRTFKFNNGSVIEFKSYGDAQDAKSGKRDYLFINEANGVAWEIYNELSLRTRKRIYVDFNPNSSFWVHEKLIGKKDVQLIITDHRHNPYLLDNVRLNIESLKNNDTELWRVYARGLTGRITGLILNNWHICEKIPNDARLLAAGLDFGYSNDETGCVLVYKQHGELWVHEVIYETKLTNTDIAERLKVARVSKNTEIIADSAEPKSIEELRRLGWNITPARKGPDSVKNSIDILKRYKINITRQSPNLKTELEKYKWRTDKSGKSLNEPVDSCNHLIDPLRYVALNKLKIRNLAKPKSRLPTTSEHLSDFASLHLVK